MNKNQSDLGNFQPRDMQLVTKDFGIFGRVDVTVFIISAIIALGFIAWGAANPESLGAAMSAASGWILKDFGWMYMLEVFAFVVFLFVLAFSRLGKIRLGKDSDRPEYSTFSWFAMLFGCGMGVGLVYWSIGEPIYHMLYGPTYAGEPGSIMAQEYAMAISFFHWGLSAWATYVIVGVPMGLVIFRKGLPALLSSCFYPVLGDKIYGPIGKTIDVISLLITFFGMSTTVGLGTMQLASGLSFQYGFTAGMPLNIGILAVVAVTYLASACLPIDKGIKTGSDISMIACIGLMLFLVVLGPTKYIFDNFVNATGIYLQEFVKMSLWTDPAGQTGWLNGWTIFYWAWWITWAPFVGMFIAKISKGRTVREFILAALIAPSIFDMLFFDIFGSTAIKMELAEATKGSMLEAISNDVSSAIFVMFDKFPAAALIAPIILFVVFTFFVVSADSATIVLGMLSSGGDDNPKTALKILWGIAMACSAGILLYLGGLTAVQQIAIVSVFPFSFAMLWLMYSTVRMIREDKMFAEPVKSE